MTYKERLELDMYWYSNHFTKKNNIEPIRHGRVTLNGYYDVLSGLRSMQMVYVLTSKKEIVYVGCTKSLFTRTQWHIRDSKVFDAIYFLVMPDRKTALEFETFGIKRFKPKYNFTHNKKP